MAPGNSMIGRRRSEMSALVEKKTGFDGSRTLIQSGFFARWSAGSIFVQDMGADFMDSVRESNRLTSRAFSPRRRGRAAHRGAWRGCRAGCALCFRANTTPGAR